MKNKPDKAAAGEAVRVAALKVAKAARIAEADDRVARAAKARFKDAKKSWKLARKVAKRSAKRVKLAEKNLVALQKYLKRSGKKTKTKATTNPKPVTRQRNLKTSRKRVLTVPPPAPAAVDSVPPTSGESGAT